MGAPSAFATPVRGSVALQAAPAAPAAPFRAGVTWDGTNVSSAHSPTTAFTLTPGQKARVFFGYVEPVTQGPHVTNASLTLTYLGVVIESSITPAHPTPQSLAGAGFAEINWSFGSLYQVIEGAFQLTASLLDKNGSTVWSEPFYVDARAPYSLESGFVVVLLILFVLEAYYIAAAFRTARGGRRASPPPPSAPPPVPPASPAAGEATPPPENTSAGTPPGGPS